MNKSNRYPQIRDRIIKLIFKGNNTWSSYWITFVVRRYLYYAFRALVNGYPINVRRTARIFLIHEKPKNYGKKVNGKIYHSRIDRMRYAQSDKIYGYMFSITFQFEKNNIEHRFCPDTELRTLLRESVGSDNVYELIKP